MMYGRVEFTSAAWDGAWEDKLVQADILPRLEYETVRQGVRPCALTFGVQPERLHALRSDYASEGLMIEPIERVAVTQASFSHVVRTPADTDAYTLKCVVARSRSDIDRFTSAERQRDDITIGAMLGYPRCCARFFDRVWRAGCFDPIFQSAENTRRPALLSSETCRDANGNPMERRILIAQDTEGSATSSCLRYVGVRITSHFACSARCEPSIAVARGRIDLARRLDLSGIDAAVELLRLPCHWECHEGVAVVTTPAFRFRVASMPYAIKHVVAIR